MKSAYLVHEALNPTPANERDVRWHKIPSPAYNFYGINHIDLNRNAVTSLWIFCDIIDTSYVENVQLPLLQLVPNITADSAMSFERFGMVYRKRINKSRVDSIKIWITETYNGKPLHFREPVTILLEFYRDAQRDSM